MKLKDFLQYFIFLLLFSCTTMQFGEKTNDLFGENKEPQVRELNLSYNYKAMGVPVKGEKSVTEAVFVHPINKTVYLFISFPKIGILTSEDNGNTFSSNFFKLSFLEKIFQYQNIEENKKIDTDQEKPTRYFSHFAYSPKNPDKIVLSFGPYLFTSSDNGRKWIVNNIFFDYENVNIRDVYINNKEEIIIMTENRIAISRDWGKKWDKKFIKINNYPYYKLEYITGIYKTDKDLIYASFKFNDESDSILSKNSYDFFYNKKNNEIKSGLYYSKDFGGNWIKSKINIPVSIWEINNNIYASSIYPLYFYKYNFSEDFKRSSFYKYGILDNVTSKIALEEYAKVLLNSDPNDYQILSSKNNRIIEIKNIDEENNIIEEKNFDILYEGMKKLEDIDYLHWKNNWYSEQKSNNFSYEYNFWHIFKKWTGMRTNGAILYTKNKKIFYRINLDQKFVKSFIQYFIDKQIELNIKNPFLKKSADLEFFDPQKDPTNGFPCNIEYSEDNVKSWKILEDDEFMQKIIDPLSTKRSGFYWYKNVDQKKIFRMQLSFGFTKGVTYLVFPEEIGILGKDLYLRINYFSISKNYKDIYLIPIKK